jgi:hypothetical protein
MSTSPAQLAANAANAQHSTGPRTTEGKDRSSQNASKHGLTAREVVIGAGEQEEFDSISRRFSHRVTREDAGDDSQDY